MNLTSYQKKDLQNLLSNENTFASTLFFILLETYGTEMLEWDPETLWIEISADFNVDLPDINRDKVQALVTFYTTDHFQNSVEMFIHICNVLNGAEANFARFDPADPEEMLWTLYELSLHADKPKDLINGLNEEIRTYMGITLHAYGVYDPPDILRVAIMPQSGNIDQFADDPVMYNALWDKLQVDKQDLLIDLSQKLQRLIQELDRVPFPDKGDNWKKLKTNLLSKAKQIAEQAIALEETQQ